MNKIQKKIDKMIKKSFNFSSDIGCFLTYQQLRKVWRCELKNKYTKQQVIIMSVDELWENFDND